MPFCYTLPFGSSRYLSAALFHTKLPARDLRKSIFKRTQVTPVLNLHFLFIYENCLLHPLLPFLTAIFKHLILCIWLFCMIVCTSTTCMSCYLSKDLGCNEVHSRCLEHACWWMGALYLPSPDPFKGWDGTGCFVQAGFKLLGSRDSPAPGARRLHLLTFLSRTWAVCGSCTHTVVPLPW